jgi:hypothetical protein
MALSIQQLSDDSKFSHALRFEVLERVCPRELVSERLEQVPCLGKARTQPQPTPGRLLRDRAEPVSSAQPGGGPGPPGARAALAVGEPVSAPADRGSIGVPSKASGLPCDAPPVPASLPSDGA